MKRFFLFILSLLMVTLVIAGTWYLSHFGKHKKTAVTGLPDNRMRAILKKAEEARQFIAQNNFNDSLCFLVDMSLPSGSNRFFIYDLRNNEQVDAGLVTHGRCNRNWLAGRQYGNEIGCGCTSLGKYKIGNPYHGRFGLAYKLYGLNSTNDNAYKRFVVLHSHSCVPATEVDPAPICQSDGCPTLSPGFLKVVAAVLDNSPKPVLLWIYE